MLLQAIFLKAIILTTNSNAKARQEFSRWEICISDLECFSKAFQAMIYRSLLEMPLLWKLPSRHNQPNCKNKSWEIWASDLASFAKVVRTMIQLCKGNVSKKFTLKKSVHINPSDGRFARMTSLAFLKRFQAPINVISENANAFYVSVGFRWKKQPARKLNLSTVIYKVQILANPLKPSDWPISLTGFFPSSQSERAMRPYFADIFFWELASLPMRYGLSKIYVCGLDAKTGAPRAAREMHFVALPLLHNRLLASPVDLQNRFYSKIHITNGDFGALLPDHS